MHTHMHTHANAPHTDTDTYPHAQKKHLCEHNTPDEGSNYIVTYIDPYVLCSPVLTGEALMFPKGSSTLKSENFLYSRMTKNVAKKEGVILSSLSDFKSVINPFLHTHKAETHRSVGDQ